MTDESRLASSVDTSDTVDRAGDVPNRSGPRPIRFAVVVGNWLTLAVISALVVALVFWGPDTDSTASAIGLFGTIAGMIVKNSSTIIDYLFGGSNRDQQ